MTRETARREVDFLDYYLQNYTDDYSEESHTAMMMAIDALKSSENLNNVLNKIRAEIEQLPTKTRINWDGCCPDIDYPEIEYVDVTKNKLLSIIDKYKAESEGEE